MDQEMLGGGVQHRHGVRQIVAFSLRRLGSASSAVESWRPFLGPLFAWAAVMPPQLYIQITVMIKLIVLYLVQEIKEGHYQEAVDAGDAETKASRSDTKADTSGVVLGGWGDQRRSTPWRARWFSIRLMKKNTPLVLEGGEPYTTITTLKLLATLFCVIAFAPRGRSEEERDHEVRRSDGHSGQQVCCREAHDGEVPPMQGDDAIDFDTRSEEAEAAPHPTRQTSSRTE